MRERGGGRGGRGNGEGDKHDQIELKDLELSLLNHNMSITAKYLPSVLNTVADRESRIKPDSSEWLLHAKVFQAVSQLLGSLRQ